MKKSEALRLVKEHDPAGAKFILEYFARRNCIPRTDPSIYRFVRRHTGVTKDEWDALVEEVP